MFCMFATKIPASYLSSHSRGLSRARPCVHRLGKTLRLRSVMGIMVGSTKKMLMVMVNGGSTMNSVSVFSTETVQLYQEKNWKNVKNGGFMMINSWNRFSAGFLMDCSWVYDGYTPQTQWQVPINPLLGLGCLIKGTTSVAGEKYVRVTTELYNQPGVYRYPGLTVWKQVALSSPMWFFGMIRACNGDDRWRLLRISHLSLELTTRIPMREPCTGLASKAHPDFASWLGWHRFECGLKLGTSKHHQNHPKSLLDSKLSTWEMRSPISGASRVWRHEFARISGTPGLIPHFYRWQWRYPSPTCLKLSHQLVNHHGKSQLSLRSMPILGNGYPREIRPRCVLKPIFSDQHGAAQKGRDDQIANESPSRKSGKQGRAAGKSR